MRTIGHTVRFAATLLLLVSELAPAQAVGESAAAELDSLRMNTPELYAFLRRMPKGGDLHNHLSGSVYAESYIRWAIEDGACVSRSHRALVPGPCDPGPDTVPAAAVMLDGDLYNSLIDALSTRNWHSAWEESGHSRFFSSFGRFGAHRKRDGDRLAEVMQRAADGNVSYLELMHSVERGAVFALADSISWSGDLGAMHDAMLSAGIESRVSAMRRAFDAMEARRDSLLGCRTMIPVPAPCVVTVRFLAYALREMPPQRVYAELLAGFLLTRADARVVGVNIVQPEDGFIAMRDYSLHMRMFQYLRSVYPDVPLTLHAGELAPGLVPPEGLRNHVREAVTVAGAQRIGHGVDIMYEDDPYGLLTELAQRGVMVEINLTSNRTILGVAGGDHPLRAYLGAGVAFALSTDDEGVSRSEMTMEYVRAAQDQRLSYADLKRSARNSLEFAFVEGESIWADRRVFTLVAACSSGAGGFSGAQCVELTGRSTKANLQQQLELEFERFEAAAGRR